MLSCDDEARLRNALLGVAYGRIPSYALFYAEDIERETIERRLAWWQFFVSSSDETIASMARRCALALADPPAS